MKLVTLSHAGAQAVGCVEQQDGVVLPPPPSGEGLVGWLLPLRGRTGGAHRPARAAPHGARRARRGGRPSGVGYARNPPVFMKAGDRIEIEIEGIGVLANTIVDEE